MASSMPAGASDRALDRRQLLKAGAWSAPTLALAVAVPAAGAATQAEEIPVQPSTPHIDISGRKLTVSIQASSSETVTVIAEMTVTPDNSGKWDVPDKDAQSKSSYAITEVIPAGGTVTLTFPTFTRKSNANNKVYYTVTYTINGTAAPSLTHTAELRAS
ncbi:hypothetical protein [Microbacterium sp. C7(2022)]|uniref:hypothetical protein n=1 Tax=Microbacterium sp. C7(2022) TaxID=2992759 RepID=UPI00237B8579|nr:hypothetical protein [Microbacterium sp. C7(2022)]MDE0545358.1 hypothetical protein [Microbacterium sp. C7(2022)]